MKITRVKYELTRQQYWLLIEKIIGDTKKNDFPSFREFIDARPYSTSYIMNADDKSKRRMEMLNSPYAETLLQAWLIQYKEGVNG